MSHLTTLPETERRALVQKAVQLAGERFETLGFNCAESTLYGIAVALGLPFDESLLKMATPFGGGLGRAGCICGALSGSTMALGLVYGRSTPDAEQRRAAYEHAQRVWQRFVERTDGEDCRDINKLGFGHPDLKAQCARFVAAGAEIAAEELLGL